MTYPMCCRSDVNGQQSIPYNAIPDNARMTAPEIILTLCWKWPTFHYRSFNALQYQNGSPWECSSNLLEMASILIQVIQCQSVNL